MLIQSKTQSGLERSIDTIEMIGQEVIQIAKSGKRLEIIFHKGIALSLTQKIMRLCFDKIFKTKQGNLIATVDDFGVYIQYFTIDLENILIFIYVDKKNNIVNSCTKMYLLYKRMFEYTKVNAPISELVNECKKSIKIQQLYT
jgi:hypothetical protein